MRTAKFIHAADLHLGSPLKSLGDLLDNETIVRVRERANSAYTRLVDIAISEGVDFVLFSGDIYDMADRDPGAQRRFLLGLRRLVDAGIKVFMAHGNHDPLTKDIRNDLLPHGVTVFPAGSLGEETITMRNGVEVVVAGVSYRKKEESDNLVPLFSQLRGRTVIGVLHTNVGGNASYDNYAPSSVADLEKSPVHYWALGHIHIRSVNRTNKGWWAYPGNLQGRSIKAAECGPKGALLVEVDEDGTIHEPEFVDCAPVRFERIDVLVDDIEDIAQVGDRVNAELIRLVEECGDKLVLVRIELVGQTSLHELRTPNSEGWKSLVREITDEGNDILGSGSIIKVRTSCSPQIDLVAERSRETLLGTVLRTVDDIDEDDALKHSAIAVLVNALGATR